MRQLAMRLCHRFRQRHAGPQVFQQRINAVGLEPVHHDKPAGDHGRAGGGDQGAGLGLGAGQEHDRPRMPLARLGGDGEAAGGKLVMDDLVALHHGQPRARQAGQPVLGAGAKQHEAASFRQRQRTGVQRMGQTGISVDLGHGPAYDSLNARLK